MADRVDVEVSGIPELLGHLAALQRTEHDALDTVIGDAADATADRARTRMPLGPAAGGHLRGSVEVDRAEGLAATVHHGGARYPYAGWLEFGGHVGRRHAVHRPWIPRGRYLYPALSTVYPGLEPSMIEHMRSAAAEAGWIPSG